MKTRPAIPRGGGGGGTRHIRMARAPPSGRGPRNSCHRGCRTPLGMPQCMNRISNNACYAVSRGPRRLRPPPSGFWGGSHKPAQCAELLAARRSDPPGGWARRESRCVASPRGVMALGSEGDPMPLRGYAYAWAASPGLHRLGCIAWAASPGLHRLGCIAWAASPGARALCFDELDQVCC